MSTLITIESEKPEFAGYFGGPPPGVCARVVLEFPPGYAKAALAELCLAVMDVLVEARKVDGTHG